VVLALGDYRGVTCHACIGATNVRDDIEQLESGVQIVVGTPGRVYDMLNRSALRRFSKNVSLSLSLLFHLCSISDSKSIKMFVLDEADEMLSGNFKEQIHDVFITMPQNIQA
jgi:translation initiation factor 4A